MGRLKRLINLFFTRQALCRFPCGAMGSVTGSPVDHAMVGSSCMCIERLEDLKAYDVVYVSPHLDDVAFSCTGHIQEQRRRGLRVLVVTVFTGRGEGPARNEFADYRPRLEEDELAMKILGVYWFYGGFEEVIFRHNVAHRAQCVPLHITVACFAAWFCSADANATLVRRMAELLQDIVSKVSCSWLLGPAGIGFHADHLLTHRACLEVAVPRMSFYYDWPYCIYAPLRSRLMTPHLLNTSLEEFNVEGEALQTRRDAVVIYATQVTPIFGSTDKAIALIESDPFERILHKHEVPRWS